MKKSSIISSFVIGSKNEIPKWLDDECKKGRVKIIYDDDKNIELVKIFSPSATYELVKGDKVIKNKHGLVGVKY
jgi:hypothetical protein